jgi:hypothetical protein
MLQVAANRRVPTHAGRMRVDALAALVPALLPARSWQRYSAGAGTTTPAPGSPCYPNTTAWALRHRVKWVIALRTRPRFALVGGIVRAHGAAQPGDKGAIEMNDERHLMVCTDSNGAQSYFECTVKGCGRRVILDHVDVSLIVLDRGSTNALHNGSTGLVALSGAVQAGQPTGA